MPVPRLPHISARANASAMAFNATGNRRRRSSREVSQSVPVRPSGRHPSLITADEEELMLDRCHPPDRSFFEQAKIELARHEKDLQTIEGDLCERSWDLEACSAHLEACASTWRQCDDSLVARFEQLMICQRKADEMKFLQDDANKAISLAVRSSCQNWNQRSRVLPRATLLASTGSDHTSSLRHSSSDANLWTPQKCLTRRRVMDSLS
mmetsp:Transcript_20028/g.46623  ORF Transcript_20028/g.46623 Transcript_20028/m.46623 type:complete len:209 (-) Transcript_20028:182-808(-)